MYKCKSYENGYLKAISPLSELETKKVKLYYSCQRADSRRRNEVKNYSKVNPREEDNE